MIGCSADMTGEPDLSIELYVRKVDEMRRTTIVLGNSETCLGALAQEKNIHFYGQVLRRNFQCQKVPVVFDRVSILKAKRKPQNLTIYLSSEYESHTAALERRQVSALWSAVHPGPLQDSFLPWEKWSAPYWWTVPI